MDGKCVDNLCAIAKITVIVKSHYELDIFVITWMQSKAKDEG